MSEAWRVAREQAGVSMESAEVEPRRVAWRVRDELGQSTLMPDEAAALASFSLAVRCAILRARLKAQAI